MAGKVMLRMDVEESAEVPDSLVLHILIPAMADLAIAHGADPETGEPGTIISIEMPRDVFDQMHEYLTERRLSMELP